jgi:AAA family ATP:ADP antiporter
LSLFTQLAVVPRVLKHAGPVLALAVLPLGLAVGGVGLLLGFGLGAALVVKGADGGLRYSLHRTATELLYVPLPDRVRSRVRATLDVFGQRAGQAVASILILVIVAAKVPLPAVAACFIAIAAAWVVCALALRQPYVSVLGASLRRGAALRAPVFPELDVASLETLVASLDSNDDAEVLAGIEVLEREGKERLVPALLLRHPSDAVVERTLAVLVRSRRTSAVASIDAVLDHTSIPVRRAAIAARSILEHDAKLLYQRLSLEEAPEVRATIVVHLIASGELVGKEAADRLDELVAHGDAATKSALAGAIGMRDHHAFDHVLGALAVAAEPEVRVAAVEAMAQHRSPSYLPILVRALGSERTRSAAKSALVAFGDAGFAAARDALRDHSLPRDVRWALPQTLAAFDHEPAADVLLAELVREPSGVVRYRIIRALETLVASHPRLRLRRAALSRVVEETLSKAFRRIDQRLLLEAGAASVRERATPGYELLRDALSDKETGLRDRLLRLLGLIHPQVDFASVRRGLRASSAKTRASSVELVASVVDTRIRGAVVALLEDLPPEERLEGAGAFYHPEPAEYDELLAQMLREEGEALREIVAFHLDELRSTKEVAC